MEAGHDEVRAAVSIEVAHGYRIGIARYAIIDPCAEGSVANAQKDGNIVAPRVRYCQIEFPVLVEIRDSYGEGVVPGRVGYGGSERSVSKTQAYRDIVIPGISRSHVKFAVPVEVPQHDPAGTVSGGVGGRRFERKPVRRGRKDREEGEQECHNRRCKGALVLHFIPPESH